VFPAAVLWDFGDTLVDERWMQHAPAACPDWPKAWAEVMTVHAGGWNMGSTSDEEVFVALADRTGMTVEAVTDHAERCCHRLERRPVAWRTASERRCPQALVTVNPSLFDRWIVPGHDLAAMFDVIVISAQEGTADKTALCLLALDRLRYRGPRLDALLIDNRADLVEAWRAVGGSAYHFTDDAQFAEDLPTIFEA
jgi:hypothetical protein